jgi:peroxiredoxin Q/BCP
MLREGDQAPDFTLKNDEGQILRMGDFLGKKTMILFFYPKANTPG